MLVGVKLRIEPGWHIYWRNPGDTGVPTSVLWDLPAEWKVGEVQWPAPKVFADSGLVSYGYEEEVVLLARVEVPASAKPGAASIKAQVSWLACQEACIPGSARGEATLRVGVDRKESQAATRLAAEQELLPFTAGEAKVEATNDGFVLTVAIPPGQALPEKPLFVPEDSAVVRHTAQQEVTLEGSVYTFRLKRSEYASGQTERLRGVLLAQESEAWLGKSRAILIDAPVQRGGDRL